MVSGVESALGTKIESDFEVQIKKRALLNRMRYSFAPAKAQHKTQCATRFARVISALDHIQRKAREAGLLVARLHIQTREIHGTDHLIE